jgi:protein TonB
VGTRNAISMLHIPRLQELPLGLRNAFIKCAMATWDHPTDLVHRVAYPALVRPGLRTDSRLPASPLEKETGFSASSSLQGVEAGDIFRESLIASGKSRRRNPWATVGALGFELLVLLTVVIAPLYRTIPLPKREIVTMLYLQPPPAAVGNATKIRAPKPMSTYSPTRTGITAPVHKAQEAPPPLIDTTGGVVGGLPGGMVGGIPGGTLSEALSSTRSAPVPVKTFDPTPVKRIRVAARVVEANLIRDVAPQYPPEAGRARIEGTVVLLAVIGTDGSVKDVRVENGLPILAQAAIDAVKQWRYKPYMIDGEPVEVDSRITINFTLSAS